MFNIFFQKNVTSSDGDRKTSNQFSRIKKSHMLLIYHEKKLITFGMFTRIIHVEKNHDKTFTIFECLYYRVKILYSLFPISE